MSFIKETEYAVRNLFDLVLGEARALSDLQQELHNQTALAEVNETDFRTSEWSDDFSDAHVQGAFHRMAKARQSAEKLQIEAAALRSSIASKTFSHAALSGAILQIAKQGLSTTHGPKNKAPKGRLVSNVPLRDVIWDGRNQAMHYEEGKYNKDLLATFNDLAIAYGTKFDLTINPTTNMAAHVLEVLGWTLYDAFVADLKSLGVS